ncbi:DUF445 family protein [Planctomycetota bacterium]|jgi:uncharacterized membrane protein YheB (UPF0754 family)|nr:DUF445 family protein [Planctomycetota bacterium]MDB4453944.1 DUF445 family protein [bacterium]MDB4736481.1 DUF445 family protein [Planctomycetota bacterium]
MPEGLLPWFLLPLVGALIGYGTNRLAVGMIFRPIEPRKFLGFTFQGLVGRRQPELAKSIGNVVGDHLLRPEDLEGVLESIDLEPMVEQAFAAGLEPKLAEFRRMPLVGALLTEERVGDLRAQAVKGVMEQRGVLVEGFQEALDRGLDVHRIVEEKVASFPIARLEALIIEVAARELRSIEVLGGVLGALIGLIQAALLAWLG